VEGSALSFAYGWPVCRYHCDGIPWHFMPDLLRFDAVVTTSIGDTRVTVHFELIPLIALIAGIAILVVPKLLRYIVAGYLIFIGVIGLIT
jgi:hypothetical protein